jgi:prolycopene isomerase
MPPLAARVHAPILLAPVAPHPATRLCASSGRRGGVGGFRRGALASEKPQAVAVAEKAGGEVGGGEGEGPYDAIVIGSGIGGLVAATQLAAKGARVLVLEKYLIPGGSSGYYRRDGFTFDVGSSVMFGFSDKVNSLVWGRFWFCSTCAFLGSGKFGVQFRCADC